jgi:Ca-activated chloride channel homolog
VANTVASLDQQLTFDAAAIKAAAHSYDSKVFNGMTTTCAGLDMGIAELKHAIRGRQFAGKTVVFLTDGFRTGGNDPVASAQAAANDDIVIHTVTFGANFNQSEMIEVAEATGGKHYHAPDAATLTQIFREIASSSVVMLTK